MIAPHCNPQENFKNLQNLSAQSLKFKRWPKKPWQPLGEFQATTKPSAKRVNPRDGHKPSNPQREFQTTTIPSCKQQKLKKKHIFEHNKNGCKEIPGNDPQPIDMFNTISTRVVLQQNWTHKDTQRQPKEKQSEARVRNVNQGVYIECFFTTQNPKNPTCIT